MNTKRVRRAMLARGWYNLTERLAQAALYVPLPEGITLEKDLHYGSEKMERMDYIYPSDKPAGMPLVIYIHGGGWLSGIKNMRRYYCYEWAKKGFFTANLDYTYAPDKQFPAQLQELLDAIGRIIDDSANYGYDTSRAILAGESAGGYFITELAALLKNKELMDRLGLRFKHYERFYPKALVCICGAVDLPALYETHFPDIGVMTEAFLDKDFDYLKSHAGEQEVMDMSPLNYITPDFPPTMVISADHDPLRKESYKLIDVLKSKGIPLAAYEGTGIIGNHAWPIAVKVEKGRECFNATLDFVNEFIK